MVLNESAYYKGKLWCAYELKDHSGRYKEELRLTMRKESQDHQFTCPDCGEPLILCAGPIMEPFFKHYENTHCIIDRKEVNRRNIVARRILYHLAKDSFPDAIIELDKKLEVKTVPDIWIQTKDTVLVFEYLSYELKLADWEAKHAYYQEHGIVDVWFLNYKKYQYEINTTFEYMISRTSRVLKFLDYEAQEVVLKQTRDESGERIQWIAKSYPVEELRFNEQGEAICDYEQYRKEQIALAEYEEKLEQLRRREEAAKRNRLKGHTGQKDTYEQQSLFLMMENPNGLENVQHGEEPIPATELVEADPDRQGESNEFIEENPFEQQHPMEQPAADRFVRKPAELHGQSQNEQWGKEELLEQESTTSQTKAVVHRYSMDSDKVSSMTMKMSAIDELWELPALTGKEWQIRAANQKRYLYLKKLNRELMSMNPEMRKQSIQEALTVLETHLEADLWR